MNSCTETPGGSCVIFKNSIFTYFFLCFALPGLIGFSPVLEEKKITVFVDLYLVFALTHTNSGNVSSRNREFTLSGLKMCLFASHKMYIHVIHVLYSIINNNI